MKIAVLASSDSWYLRDLQRAANARELIHGLPFSRLTSSICGASTTVAVRKETLNDFDAVLVRTMPPGSLEQVVFRMDALHRLEVHGTRVVNHPKAIEAAVDKYLTLAKLQAVGLDVPRTETSQTPEDAMESFHRLGRDVVLKPLFGSEGRGITRVSDEAIAERAFKLLAQLGAVIYQQEFVQHHGWDLRLLVLGQQVLGMRRVNRLDWRTNISRGATSEPQPVTEEFREIALRAADSVGAQIAGVDLLPAKDGRLLTIEVNAVPGWRALSKTCNVDVARGVLDLLAL